MHKLISCDYTASAEIDGDKFGITMLGTCHSFALHFIFVKDLSISCPVVVENLVIHSFLEMHLKRVSSTHVNFESFIHPANSWMLLQ